MNRLSLHLIPPALFSLLLILFLSILSSGCARKIERENVLREFNQPLLPAAMPEQQLQPGLSVLYFHEFYRHVSQMPTGEKIASKGREGQPILQLDHRFAKGVNVFDSGDSTAVGMMLSGYLHLAAGEYTFQANTNDGFELYLNDTLIISDPGVHGDRLSDMARIIAAREGWFPVLIKYFQRKGSAALSLRWQQGEAGGFTVIPASAYAHLPR